MRELQTPELLRRTIEGALLDVHTSIAGSVVSFDPATWRATIRPAVRRQAVDSDSPPEVVTVGDVPDVPVLYPRGGGFFLYWPLQVGDLVRLEFSEEDDEQVYGTQEPLPVTPEALRRFGSHMVARPEGKRGDPTATGAAMLIGIESGVQIEISDDLIKLAGGDQFAAMANLVKSEIQALRDYVASHTHLAGTLLDGMSSPVTGATGAPAAPPAAVGDVAALKVKVT